MAVHGDFFLAVNIAVTTAIDMLVTVILDNTPHPHPQRVTCSALALAAAETDL